MEGMSSVLQESRLLLTEKACALLPRGHARQTLAAQRTAAPALAFAN